MLFFSKLACQNIILEIHGPTPVETQNIDALNYAKTHKDYASIHSEINTVQKNLFKLGYIENKLITNKRVNDSTFRATIHLKRLYSHIHIYYDQTTIPASILNTISNNVNDNYFQLDFTEIESALNFINSKLTEDGYPFSKLQLSEIKIKNQKQLEATLDIVSNEEKRYIDNIVIKGYENFPRAYLKHYLKLKRSQTFDLSTIKKKLNQLSSLKFASEIKPSEVLFSKDSTKLYLYLKKTQSNAFDGFLGFNTNEDTNKIEFNGYLDLNLTNNLNYGESFQLLYKSGQNDQKTFEAKLTLPYLFKTPVGIDLLLHIYKQDSTFTTTNQSAKLHYQIHPKHKVYTGLLSTTSSNLLNETTSNTVSNYKTNFYTLAYEFTSPQPNSSLFPVNTQFYLETNFGKRKAQDTEISQTLISANTFKIFNLNKKNSVLFKIQSTLLDSKSYYDNELARFGGINSIRGFQESSLFATLFSVLNTEYRFLLNNNLYIHSITDVAYFENKILNTEEKLFGFGLGFGLLSNTGLFKFNYANGKSENKKFKLSNSTIHLSFIANF